MTTHMADYLCVVRFAPCSHVERDGEEAVFTTLHLLLSSHSRIKAFSPTKTLDRNPKTREERADLGLIRLRDERLDTGFRAE